MVKRKSILIMGVVLLGIVSALGATLALLGTGVVGGSAQPLVFASASVEAEYTGNAVTSDKFEITSGKLKDGHTAYADMSGTQTEAGTSDNAFTITVLDERGNDVTDEYKFDCVYGKLTVLPRKLELKSGDGSKVYDGTELKIESATVADGTLAAGNELVYTYVGGITKWGEAENVFSARVIDSKKRDVTANYAITYSYGKLTVTQRQVTVTLNGYTGTSTQSWAGEEYTGNPLQPDLSGNNVGQFLSVVTQNWYGNTGDSSSGIVDCAKIVLSVNNDAVNVGNYPMFICQSDANTNYLVNFVNNGNTLATGTAHNNELDETLRPVFNIRPKALTVQVVLNGTENQTSFNIIYGNNADTYYDVTYGGLVERDRVAGDNHKFNIDGGLIVSNNIQYRAVRSGMATEYNPWVSNAREVYTVSASGLDLHNYAITFKPATMTQCGSRAFCRLSQRLFRRCRKASTAVFPRRRGTLLCTRYTFPTRCE